MKAFFAQLRRRWQAPLMLAAGFLPAPLMLCAFLAPQAPWSGVPAALAYVCAAWVCAAVAGRRRLLTGALGAMAIVALGLAALPWRDAPVLLAIPALYVFLLLMGLPAGGELPPAYPCVGLGLHVAAQIAADVGARTGGMQEGVLWALRGTFVVFGVLGLLALNRASLKDAAVKGSPAPLTVRRKNLLLTLALGAAALFIACLPAVARLCERVWHAALAALGRLLRWLSELFAVELAAETGGAPAAMDMQGAAAGAPNPFWEILEKIVVALGAIAAAVFAALLLRLVWKRMRRWLRVLAERLRRFVQAASEDYQDEIADTREGGSRSRLFRRRARGRDLLRGVDAAKLAPRERVRFYYLRARLRRPDWTDGQTAREHLPADAAEIYERARYSPHAVSEADAGTFERRVR